MTKPWQRITIKRRPHGHQVPGGKRESTAMSNTPATSPSDANVLTGDATSREHAETAAEGTDGRDMPEIRMHTQDAAEGPDDD